jgi:CRISPR-associated endonuclease Cas3-HD
MTSDISPKPTTSSATPTLGKYAPAFQKMIREANGFEAHIEGDAGGPRDHSSAGAIHAAQTLGEAGQPIAFAIAGHHAGLANQSDLRERLRRKGDPAGEDRCLVRARDGGAPADLLTAAAPPLPAHLRGATDEHRRGREMYTRMLFSALCDADFLDTEAFYREGQATLRGRSPAIGDLASQLDQRLDALEAGAPTTEVNRVRAEVRQACAAAAQGAPGVFSLTVPTGGGKTLVRIRVERPRSRRPSRRCGPRGSRQERSRTTSSWLRRKSGFLVLASPGRWPRCSLEGCCSLREPSSSSHPSRSRLRASEIRRQTGVVRPRSARTISA